MQAASRKEEQQPPYACLRALLKSQPGYVRKASHTRKHIICRCSYAAAARPACVQQIDSSHCCRYTTPFQPFLSFLDRACEFQVVVFATFPEHHLDLANKLADMGCPGQRSVHVVHNPRGLESSGEQHIHSVNATLSL